MQNSIYNGFFNILKPSGPTSSNIVTKIKRMLGGVKTGHMGTLDPLAAGVLPIAVGKAPKLFNILTFKRKLYRAEFDFGIETETGDTSGKITLIEDVNITSEKINEVINNFTGKINQTPHKYSAIKIGGFKAYDLARQGKDFDIKSREVIIYNLKLIRSNGNKHTFDIECSGGTYIRSLCRDIAKQLNTVATMTMLIRLKSGCFDINNSILLEDLENIENKINLMLPINYPLSDYIKIYIDSINYKALLNGAEIYCNENDNNDVLVYCKNEFFGIGNIKDKRLKVDINLRQ